MPICRIVTALTRSAELISPSPGLWD